MNKEQTMKHTKEEIEEYLEHQLYIYNGGYEQ